MLNGGTVLRSRNSLNGTARSRDCRSVRPSCFGIVSTWSLGIWRPAPSISASAQCVASPTKFRLWAVKPASGGGLTTRQGSQEDRRPTGESADAGTVAPALERARLSELKGKRDRALLAVLLARGLRRHEVVNLDFSHVQQREDHWAIVDLRARPAIPEQSRCRAGLRTCSTVGFMPRT